MRMERLIGIAAVAGAVALFAGVSVGTVLIGAVVILACPLMMMFMGHGAGGGHAAHGEHREDDSSMDSVGSRK